MKDEMSATTRVRGRVKYDRRWIEMREDGLYVRRVHGRKLKTMFISFDHILRMAQYQTVLFTEKDMRCLAKPSNGGA